MLFGTVFSFDEYFVLLGLCTGFMFVSLNISVAVLIWLPECVVNGQEMENWKQRTSGLYDVEQYDVTIKWVTCIDFKVPGSNIDTEIGYCEGNLLWSSSTSLGKCHVPPFSCFIP